MPVLIITRRESLMPQKGEPAFLFPEVPRDERGLRKLKRAIEGKLHRRNRRTGHIGHCKVHYFLSPRGNEWRYVECFREVGPDWSVCRSHVVSVLNALKTPACRCGINPHKISHINRYHPCSSQSFARYQLVCDYVAPIKF